MISFFNLDKKILKDLSRYYSSLFSYLLFFYFFSYSSFSLFLSFFLFIYNNEFFAKRTSKRRINNIEKAFIRIEDRRINRRFNNRFNDRINNRVDERDKRGEHDGRDRRKSLIERRRRLVERRARYDRI